MRAQQHTQQHTTIRAMCSGIACARHDLPPTTSRDLGCNHPGYPGIWWVCAPSKTPILAIVRGKMCCSGDIGRIIWVLPKSRESPGNCGYLHSTQHICAYTARHTILQVIIWCMQRACTCIFMHAPIAHAHTAADACTHRAHSTRMQATRVQCMRM